MVDSIGRGRSVPLDREVILAAMKSQARNAEKIQAQVAEASGQMSPMAAGATQSTGGATGTPNFADAIKNGLDEVNSEIIRADALPQDLVTGQVKDLTEVAGRLKTADLTFRFSMEIRNKLLDAYREVMRMQV